MRNLILGVYRGFGWVIWACAGIAGLATFAIMWVIDINALSRKLFNWPLPAGVEVTQALLPAVIMLPFAFALLGRQHVNTVVLVSAMPPRAQRAVSVFWMLCGCLLFAAVTWGTWRYAMRSYAMNEQVWGATVQFPMWPSKMVIAVGTALLSLQFLLEALRSLVTQDDKVHPAAVQDDSVEGGAGHA